jgi:hypothetical protein
MPDMIVEWRIAGWAENILVVLIGLAMAGLAIWLVLNAVKDVLDRAARVEKLRLKKNDKALSEWMEAYRDEHAKRIAAEQKAEQERALRLQLAKGVKHGS